MYAMLVLLISAVIFRKSGEINAFNDSFAPFPNFIFPPEFHISQTNIGRENENLQQEWHERETGNNVSSEFHDRVETYSTHNSNSLPPLKSVEWKWIDEIPENIRGEIHELEEFGIAVSFGKGETSDKYTSRSKRKEIPSGVPDENSSKRMKFTSAEKGRAAVEMEISATSEHSPNETKFSFPSKENHGTKECIPNHCVKCNISFRYTTHYLNHYAKEHPVEKPFRCIICHADYTNKSSLIRHARKHHTKDESSRIWKTRQRQPVTCEICDATFPGIFALEKHALIIHPGLKMIRCTQCPKRFHRVGTLLKHRKARHFKGHLKCESCENIFERSDALTDHKIHCRQRQSIKKTGIIVKNYSDDRKNKKIRCDECHEDVKSVTTLREHYKSKHPEIIAQPYPCHYCEKGFYKKGSLDKHMDKQHADKDEDLELVTHSKLKIYACAHCETNVLNAKEYEKHGKKHPGLPMFHCEKCGKGFSWRTSLRNHWVEAHGSARYSCPHCSKLYSVINLRRHQKRCRKNPAKKKRLPKEGYQKYYCNICDEDFNVKSDNFNRHKYRHKYYEFCQICDAGFKRNTNGLDVHMRLRHTDN